MNVYRMAGAVALAAAAGLAGCVHPGEVDVTVINRYQQAMARSGPQPRVGFEGLDSLRPTAAEHIVPLPVEDIVTDRIVETTETFKRLGTEKLPETKKELNRVELQRIVKTTTFIRDANTGQATPRVTIDEPKPMTTLVEEVPRDLREVEVHRVGAASGTPSLVTETGKLVRLSLEDAILRALANNLDIRVVSYDPAISRDDMVRAAAAFDYVLFGATNYAKQEQRSATDFLSDITRKRDWSLGLRQRTITGAAWALEWAMSRTWDAGRFSTFATRYEPTVALEVTQPLLRDAWPEFNLAQLRIARLNSKITDADFRARVEEIITQVITTYWGLVQARQDLVIQQRLLDVTRETYERVRGRIIIDATTATVKQVEAEVRIRQAVLIRARKNIMDVQDSLARLLADPQINVLGRYEVIPATPLATDKLHVSAAEQLMTALRHNPVLEQARLAIAASDINVNVAENQTLPALNLVASTGFQGLGRQPEDAHDKLLTGDFASYSIGLQLEYPVGNRERLANLRQRRFELDKAVVSLQNLADQVAVAVNERIRQINTTYEEMFAQRAAVEAARVQLQALEDTELIRARLTPEFLRVKLQAQETLANAARAELQAIVDYNNAMAELAHTTGTVLELHRVEIAMPAAIERNWPSQRRAATQPTAVTMPVGME